MNGNTIKSKIASLSGKQVQVKKDGGSKYTVYCDPADNFAVCFAIKRAGWKRESNSGQTVQIDVA